MRRNRGNSSWSSLFFCDEANSEHFAFTIDATGANIPPITPLTERIFLEAIDTLKFVEPWDIGDFRGVLDHLKIEMERLAPVAAPGFTVSCMITRLRGKAYTSAYKAFSECLAISSTSDAVT
jgi:hypothetical protein